LPFLPPTLRGHISRVVDVGANEGQWLSALLRFVSVDEVDAFEPNPPVFKRLQARMAGRPEVRCHPEAAGARREKLTIHTAEQSEFSSFLEVSDLVRHEYGERAGEVAKEFEVQVVPLDDALDGGEVIDLLKIDVEGFQPAVLAGAKETLRRTRVVLIEAYFVSHFKGDVTFGELSRLLIEEHGFEFWNLAVPMYGASGRSMWADAVFVNPALGPAGGWESAGAADVITNEFVHQAALR